MSALTAQAVLQTWEQAQGEHPVRCSLALLHAAWPDVEARQWGALPIGARDACLLTLYESLFGPELDTLVGCPACSEPLQVSFSTADLRRTAADEDGLAAPPSVLRCGGYELGYRLPNSDDLLEVIGARDDTPEAAVARLLEGCVLDARRDGMRTAVGELPPAVIDHLQQEMARRDPGADTRVALVCSACEHAFARRFDISAYLWAELDDWAQRTLAEVHSLASAYGWSEAQILALSATRRQRYIALVQG
jgi:hypothetical protein